MGTENNNSKVMFLKSVLEEVPKAGIILSKLAEIGLDVQREDKTLTESEREKVKAMTDGLLAISVSMIEFYRPLMKAMMKTKIETLVKDIAEAISKEIQSEGEQKKNGGRVGDHTLN